MIIVALADIHDDLERLAAIAEDLSAADVVLLVGDLTNFGRQAGAARVVRAVRQYADRVLAVPGNCDYPDVEAHLSHEGINLHRRSVVVDGVAFLGVEGSLPCPGKTPNEYSEKEIEAFFAEATPTVHPDDALILVTHQPRRETVTDRLRNGLHVGSESVRAFITRMQPILCLTGHIHEGRGIDSIGGTTVVNTGPLWAGSYAYVCLNRRAVEVEIRP